MRRPIAACLLVIGCAALVGCGALNHLGMGPARARQALSGHDPAHATTTLLEVPLNAKGRLNLGIENLEERTTDLQLGGDGGATLNAYAACLTVKVVF